MKLLKTNSIIELQTLAVAFLIFSSFYSPNAAAQLDAHVVYYQYDGHHSKPINVTASKYTKYPTTNISNDDIVDFVSSDRTSKIASGEIGK